MANILVVDDEPKMTSLICGQLEDDGHSVTTTVKPAEALELLDSHAYDIVVTDLSMPEISGMQVLEKALQRENTKVIMMTAYGTAETAVEAMKKGAADYLLKPFSLEELALLVTRLLEQQRDKSLSGHFQQAARSDFKQFVGSSPATKTVLELIDKVAPSDATVLLTGSSGTGKELAARLLHERSPRSAQPFIAVNCAAITETLLESEMFGHEKGSFTGADRQKRGRFELADRGTIFLDEIGEMAPSMQTKLLRVLEERTLTRVGGSDQIAVDVRVIAATNRDLKKAISSGSFREDLFYRLNVFPIRMPDLSERREDIVALAQHFLRQFNHSSPTITNRVGQLLRSHNWPGNIRELRNAIERAVILAGDEELTEDDFTLETDSGPLVAGDDNAPRPDHGLESAEKIMILEALEKCRGNKTEAAHQLKITRRRLYSRMKIHGIES